MKKWWPSISRKSLQRCYPLKPSQGSFIFWRTFGVTFLHRMPIEDLQFSNISSGQSHLLKVFSSPENYCGPSIHRRVCLCSSTRRNLKELILIEEFLLNFNRYMSFKNSFSYRRTSPLTHFCRFSGIFYLWKSSFDPVKL